MPCKWQEGHPVPQAFTTPWKTLNGSQRMWPTVQQECTNLSRSTRPWTDTTTPRDICAEAWCSQVPRQHQEYCRHSLALRGPLQTPQGRTP